MQTTVDFNNLSSFHTKRINEIASEMKPVFNDFVDDFCKSHADVEAVWLLHLISRNVYLDDTFLKICRVQLARELIAEKKADSIIGLSKAELETIKCLDNTFATENERCGFLSRARQLYQRYAQRFYKSRERREIKKRYNTIARCSENQSLRGLDDKVFVITDAESSIYYENKYHDRYFNNIQKYLDKDVVFLPYISFDNKISAEELTKGLKADPEYSFLFYQGKYETKSRLKNYKSFLSILAKGSYYINDINITKLVIESIKKEKESVLDLETCALQMEQFLKELKEKSPHIKHFVIWYEGRNFDLYTVSAIRRFFPEAECVAYELYPLPEQCIQLQFTKYQIESRHAPTKVVIPAKEYAVHFNKHSDLKICIAPILRNEYKIQSLRGKKYRLILILPLFVQDARIMIEYLDKFISKRGCDRIEVYIKNHPNNRDMRASDYLNGREPSFKANYVTGSMASALSGMRVAIGGGGSTAALEVLYSGVPLVITVGSGQFKCTSLPTGMFNEMYRAVFDQNEFDNALDHFLEVETIDNSDLENFLLPISKENVRRII